MANTNEGTMTFANLPPELFRHGKFTWTHGIIPCVCTMECIPFAGLTMVGTMQIIYGGLILSFPDCFLVDQRFDLQPDGSEIMTLQIADRRWKWKNFGWIEGRYNIPQPVGGAETPIGYKKPKRDKKPSELVKLCYQAMKESSYDLSGIDDGFRPEIDWNGVPAEELAKLADLMGCRVTLNPVNNRATLVNLSVGQQMPNLPDLAMHGSFDVNQPPVPDQFIFQGGRSLWQDDFELEPVGFQPNGEVALLNKLEYKPKDIDWEYDVPPFFPNVPIKYRELAASCVYKVWRIKTPVEIEGRKVKADKKIEELERLLPIEDRQLVRNWVVGQKLIEKMPSWVYGSFYAGNETGATPVKSLKTKNGTQPLFERGFSVDVERGLVIFSEPVYQLTESDGITIATSPEQVDRLIKPAKLWLRTSVGVRHKDTYAWERATYTFSPPGQKAGTAPFYVTRDDIQLETATVISQAGSSLTTDNHKEFEEQAEHYLRQALRDFVLTTPGAGSFAAILPIAPDGAIQQVTWQINERGEATTMIQRNREDIHSMPTYRERRYQDIVRETLRRESQGTRRKGSRGK